LCGWSFCGECFLGDLCFSDVGIWCGLDGWGNCSDCFWACCNGLPFCDDPSSVEVAVVHLVVVDLSVDCMMGYQIVTTHCCLDIVAPYWQSLAAFVVAMGNSTLWNGHWSGIMKSVSTDSVFFLAIYISYKIFCTCGVDKVDVDCFSILSRRMVYEIKSNLYIEAANVLREIYDKKGSIKTSVHRSSFQVSVYTNHWDIVNTDWLNPLTLYKLLNPGFIIF
jgi:hypothetical protein